MADFDMVSSLRPLRGGDEHLGGCCKTLTKHMLRELRDVVGQCAMFGLSRPTCALLLVGQHPAAVSYTQSAMAAARVSGAALDVHQLPEDTTQAALLQLIGRLNADDACHGIVLQLPLPPHLDATGLVHAIADEKDIDGLKAANYDRRSQRSDPSAGPCIAAACEEVLRSCDVLPRLQPKSSSKKGPTMALLPPHVVLLSVPSLLAFPLALSLEAAGCRVSCLSDEHDVDAVRAELPNADVLLIGARRPDVVAARWVRTGCVLLDLGLSTSAAPTPLDLHESPSDESLATSADTDMSPSTTPCGHACDEGSLGPLGDGTNSEGVRRSRSRSDLSAVASVGSSDTSPLTASAETSPLSSFSPLAPEPVQQRDVLCLCCNDGLSAMTAALRMRNLSHTALMQQGFLEPADKGSASPDR